ncbi:ANTAR domain-containing protein [Beijerinckia sp. L45]|uniref:ANTAR domain-containing protein n=1 Tax=Beijerinckia sp. L45 TaxID=1641855 RepID=UPI00131E7611|nr:ANTAR domain-containing protein [Beijerinckia sp. L45]
MISAFVVTSHAADDPSLRTDLGKVGVDVVGEADSRTLVQDVIRNAPDVVICYEKHPGDALFASMASLHTSAPRPVVVFTSDPDADKIERATRSGIHAYVINGYGLHRLRSVIHVAQARFRYEQLLRDELVEINARFDERKLVDRAKGILMRARQISEDDAYRALRTAAMQTKQRLGQVAQQVINSALYSDGVNRAGQLRMLSQRLVKLYAVQAAGLETDATRGLLADSVTRVDETIAILRRSLSKATFGDLIDSVAHPWATLQTAMKPLAGLERLLSIDAIAEDLLQNAERLTANLEAAGLASTLRVINVSGRQRMLAQKTAKLALIAALLDAPSVGIAPTVDAFVQGMTYLNAVPLSTAAIRADLERAGTLWADFQAALAQARSPQGQQTIATLSETLGDLLDQLTKQYERSMQMLLA